MMSLGRMLCVPCCAALLLAGCGKDDKETARFNEAIAGRGPIRSGGIDAGLLQDPSAYKPAAVSSGALGSGGNSPTAPSSGGEADVAEKSVTNVVDSFVSLSAASLLDSFDPTEVKTLIDGGFTESLQGVFDAFGIVIKTVKSKASDAENAMVADLPAQINKVAADAIEVTIVDAEHATATFDPAKMQAWAMEFAAKAAAANPNGAGTPPPTTPGAPDRVAPPDGTPPAVPDTGNAPPTPGEHDALAAMLAGGSGAAPSQPVTFPLKKVEGKWRISLGMTFSSEVADLLKEGCDITREALTQLSGRIEAVPPNDEQAMQTAVMSMMPMVMGQYSGWFQRLQTALADGGAKKPTEGEKKEETPGMIQP